MKRNEKANCGNCNGGVYLETHTKSCGSKVVRCLRYPQHVYVDTLHVCGEHPDFFEKDSSDLDAEIERMVDLAKGEHLFIAYDLDGSRVSREYYCRDYDPLDQF